MSHGPTPTFVPSDILIHPTIWLQYTNITDRQDRQTGQDRQTDRQRQTDRERTVLQTSPKNYPLLWQTDHKEYGRKGRAGRRTLLCIVCTSVVQCERTVVLRCAEMLHFSAAECGKAIRGVICATFRTRFSANYPLTAFRIPQSSLPRPVVAA